MAFRLATTQRGRDDSSDGDLATIGGKRFCTVKWSAMGSCRSVLGASQEASGYCGLEMKGLDNEVLYPLKWHRFYARKKY